MENTTDNATPKSKMELAHDFVRDNDHTAIVQRLVDLEVKAEVAINANQRFIDERDTYRKELNNWKNSITEFIKEKITEDDISIDDLKEFAEELNIELTKDIEITFQIDVKYSGKVPLDFDITDIDENDFDVRINFNNSDEDIDIDEDYSDIEHFEVSEN